MKTRVGCQLEMPRLASSENRLTRTPDAPRPMYDAVANSRAVEREGRVIVLTGSNSAERGVRVDTVTEVDGVVVVVVLPTRAAVPCPACGQLARRVHSRYRRTVRDLPWQGVAVRLELHARLSWLVRPSAPSPSVTPPADTRGASRLTRRQPG